MYEAKIAVSGRAVQGPVRQEDRKRGENGTHAGGWFGIDLLAELQALNLEVVRWLRAQALAGPVEKLAPLLADNRARWQQLDERAAREMSLCPCALTDAEFADGGSWQAIAAAAVRDAPGAPGAARSGEAGVLLAGPRGRQLARLTIQLAWHLARHRPVAATIALGMSAATANQLQSMRLATVDVLPDWLPALVRPRWQDEPRVWQQLLDAAISGEPLDLEAARVGALQLIARQLSGSRDATG